MKKSIITLILVILSNLVIAQSYYNTQTEFFHTKLTNGLGFEKIVKFRLSKSDYDKIKVEKKDVIKHIDNEINSIVTDIQKDLSMDFVENNINNIKYDSILVVTLVYKTQNRYGSYSTLNKIDELKRIEQEMELIKRIIGSEGLSNKNMEYSKRQLEEIAVQTAELVRKFYFGATNWR
jgi:CRISPR/Cas system CMR-associated protein Cmr1 (group 7 of RAMP superfamily)